MSVPISSTSRKLKFVFLKFAIRISLVAAAIFFILPYVSGIKFHGDIWGALTLSVVFNAVFFGLECILAVLVFGINIGTLGLGVLITGAVKFIAAMLSPSLALYGTAQILPGLLHISNYFPGAVVAGLMLGGLLWASIPDKKHS